MPIQSKEDLQTFIDMCRVFHQESRYSHIDFSVKRVCETLQAVSNHPEKTFMEIMRNEDSKIVGIFVGSLVPFFFSDKYQAQDLVFYILPEYRGSSWFIKTLLKFEKWGIEHGASFMTIYHDTGINPDKIGKLMDKFNYAQTGQCFSKEL